MAVPPSLLSVEEIRPGFSFDEQVQKYTAELESAEGLILIHPDWWGQPPGLLKGWVDRVFRPGVAYTFEGQEFMKKHQVPLLKGKRALVFASTDAEDSGTPHLLENLWQQGVFAYCGINKAEVHILYDTFHIDYVRRTAWLEMVEQKIRDWFPANESESP